MFNVIAKKIIKLPNILIISFIVFHSYCAALEKEYCLELSGGRINIPCTDAIKSIKNCTIEGWFKY